VSNGKLRRTLRQRKTALYASVAGIAVAAAAALTALPSEAGVTPGSAIPASAITALRTHTFQLARYMDDAHPVSIRAVFTIQAKALETATPGDLVPGSAHRSVYLVIMTGNFRDEYAPVPFGARIPTGRYLAITINPSTFEVMDLSIGNHRPPVRLHSYGPVSDLTKQQG
jgi:hypothetical protein